MYEQLAEGRYVAVELPGIVPMASRLRVRRTPNHHYYLQLDRTVCHRNLTMRELDGLIDEMAVKYKDDKKIDLDAAKAQLREKMAAAESKLHGTTVSNRQSHFLCTLLNPGSQESCCHILQPSRKALQALYMLRQIRLFVRLSHSGIVSK